MKTCRRLIALLAFSLAPLFCHAQEQAWEIITPQEYPLDYHFGTGLGTATNGVIVKYSGAVLTARRATINEKTGQTEAEGDVRIQRDDQVWVGEHMRYNFKTRMMEAAQFRTGKAPVFASGKELKANTTNNVYESRNGFVTTEDFADPALKIRTGHLVIVPGKYVAATHAVVLIHNVPVFYFPYYRRNLDALSSHFNFTPGYRSSFGPFLLSSYNWYWHEELDGALRLDYRVKRGVGGGPDLNYHLGRWGEGTLGYYYIHDENPELDLNGKQMPDNRQRVSFSYLACPFTNFDARAVVRYQSDPGILREFFEGEYRQNPQPNTFIEINKFWNNFSLDAFTQVRVNDFFETVERLPDIRLTGFRQQLGVSPFYYESETSAGWFRRRFADTNGPVPLDYSASRADTFHQILMPNTFFGWLNFTPRVGGRFTYYSEAHGAGGTNSEQYRAVFNTGAELSLKASYVWPGLQNKFFGLDGLRHIFEPSINYVFVPTPNRMPKDLPQFDSELPSLRLQPIEFPDYNAIDSIDSQNVFRFGLRNKLQTKREGEIVDFLDWETFMDWRVKPQHGQQTFADIYSDLKMRPCSWLTLESETRFDINSGHCQMSYHTLMLQPNAVWNWNIGHFYLRDDLRSDPTALGVGNNLITSSVFYRLNENWGARATHHFEARDGRLEEQYYTLYRDLRSWTAALTFRLRNNRAGQNDFTVALTFSLKAFPRFGLNSDTANPYSLLGG